MAGGLYLPAVNFATNTAAAATTAKIGGQVPQAVLNQVATSTAKQQMQAAGDWAVAGILYGTDTLGADLWDFGVIGNTLVLFLVWGYGPWDGIEEFLINDAPPAAGVSVTHYDGTQTTHDPLLAQLYGVTGNPARLAQMIYPNLVYTVAGLPGSASASWPNCKARWRGRKLYDPRTGLTAHSDNSALAQADWRASPVYGHGRTIIWDSVVTPANRADELLGGHKRNPINLTLRTREFCDHWSDAIRTYADCWVLDDGASAALVADMPGAPVMDFDHDAGQGQILDIAPLSFGDPLNTPNIVEIEYTDTTQKPWRTAKATAVADGIDAAGTDVQLTRISMPGIHSASQAERKSIERLNRATLGGLSTTLVVPPRGRGVKPGDLIRVRHSIGLALNTFRVGSTKGVATTGRYELSLTRYDPDFYSDKVVSVSTIADTNLPNPSLPPTPTGLVVVEENVKLDGARWTTRLRGTWDKQAWPFLRGFRVLVRSGTEVVAEGKVDSAEFVTPEVQDLAVYEWEVYALSVSSESAIPATDSIIAQGNLLAPTDIATMDLYEVGGTVHITLGPSIDKNLQGIEVRYGAPGVTWAAAKLARFVATASGVGAVTDSDIIPVGTWDLLACGRDKDRYSVNPIRRSVTVTADINSYLINSYDSTMPVLTNMAEYRLGPLDTRRYFCTTDGQPLSVSMPGALAAYTGVLATHHAPVASEWLGEPEDFGLTLSGDWAGTATVEALSGTPVSSIGVSLDAATWTYLHGLSQKATGRFCRLKHETSGTDTMRVTVPTQNIRVACVPRVEGPFNGLVSLVSGGKRVRFNGCYTAITKINITPLGAVPLSFGVDDPLVAPVHGLQLDAELPAGTTGDSYLYWDIAEAAAYTTQAGDVLELEYYLAAGPEFAQSVLLYNGVWGSGTQAAVAPLSGAPGVWQSASVAVTAGLALTHVALVNDADTPGQYKTVLRNVRMTDGAGTVRHSLYGAEGEPSKSQQWRNGSYINVRCGPANSMLVYLWSASTQVAATFNATVEAV